MGKILNVLFSIPFSLYWNLKLYGIKGIKMPILIHYKTKMQIKGILLPPPLSSTFSSKIGFGGSEGVFSHACQIISIAKNARIEFKGSFVISEGGVIRVEKEGVIQIGHNIYCNKNIMISCDKCIQIGNDVLMGWNVAIRDSDGHQIFVDNSPKQNEKSVVIGNHVWICTEAHILKGSAIPNDCVVGYHSIVCTSFQQPNSLITGSPAKIIQNNITWKK